MEKTVIKPSKKWFDINLKEILKHKDLIFLLVKRNIVAAYKQTILGPLWAFIQPLLTTFVFTFVFGTLAGLSTDGAPQFLFYLCSNITWLYFSNCLNSVSNTFIGNAYLFKKVYFPRLIMPITTVITYLVTLGIQSLLFIISCIISSLIGNAAINISIWLLFVPVLIVMIGLLSIGLGIIICSITTKYRDLLMLVSFGIQLWHYATPVAYGTTVIPEHLLNLYMLNPMAPIVCMMRYCVLGSMSNNMTLEQLLIYLAIAAAIIIFIAVIGLALFSRIEKNFVDTV
ncbi:MAG: ABC transporter permease [Clostridia bacterium]|nr:ABC transporter permease [Clostridia bacterium]